MTPHPHAMSDLAITTELTSIEASLDATLDRPADRHGLEREQAGCRRWMVLRDEQRRRDAERAADALAAMARATHGLAVVDGGVR